VVRRTKTAYPPSPEQLAIYLLQKANGGAPVEALRLALDALDRAIVHLDTEHNGNPTDSPLVESVMRWIERRENEDRPSTTLIN
jgi:hypothetical protein